MLTVTNNLVVKISCYHLDEGNFCKIKKKTKMVAWTLDEQTSIFIWNIVKMKRHIYSSILPTCSFFQLNCLVVENYRFSTLTKH